MNKSIDWEMFHELGALTYTHTDEFGRFRREPHFEPSIGLWQAIEIMGRELIMEIALEKIASGEQVDHFSEIRRLCSGARFSRKKDFELAKERAKAVDLQPVAEALGLGPVRQGMIKSITNPEERTPSLHLYRNGRGYYDFAMGQGGDNIKFVMVVTGKNFVEAVDYLQHFA